MVRIILTIAVDEMPSGEEPKPGDFPTRVDYRKALIERQEQHVRRAVGDTLRSLTGLGLLVIGGEIMPIIVAEGSAEQISLALALPGVKVASLDHPLVLTVLRVSSAILSIS